MNPKKAMGKARPWHMVKIDYLLGTTPAELEKKYNIPKIQISNRACKYGWKNEKDQKVEVVLYNHRDRIEKIIDKSLTELERIINSSSNDKDVIAASKVIIDISGLKKETIDSNINTDKEIIFNVTRKIVNPVKDKN